MIVRSSLNFAGVDISGYEGCRFTVDGTTFLVFGRRTGIGTHRIYEAVRLTWPKWLSYFPVKTQPITIVETDWGLGGGCLGAFVLAVHLRGAYDETSSRYLETILGWGKQDTGLDYIETQFAQFENPLQSYVNDQIAHEFGHIFFLHGITDIKDEAEFWFGLGLGMVYDRLIWKEISEIPSPVFEAFDRVWKQNFANNTAIDQRLIGPDTKNDDQYGLVRLQTYGHAKSCAYLSELRTQVGAKQFDAYVRSYLSRPIGSVLGYDDFLKTFSEDDLLVVRRLESEFIVR